MNLLSAGIVGAFAPIGSVNNSNSNSLNGMNEGDIT